MQGKQVRVTVISIVLCSLVLAGCGVTQPVTDTSQDIQLTQSRSATPPPSSADTTAAQSTSSSYTMTALQGNIKTPAPAASPLSTSTTTKGTSGMKTLSDFTPIEANTVTLTTTKGDIVIELYKKDVPVTMANFLNLVSSGFYDGIVFHRVIPNFMAQMGDPLTKDPSQQARWGTGGPGYTIPDEFVSNYKHDSEGIVSMANVGQPNTGGSQIFITFAPTPHLDGKHTVFGKVTKGLAVLRTIEQGDVVIKATYQ